MVSAAKIAEKYLQRYADAKNGKKTGDRTGVGLFIPIPKDLAEKFPSLGEDDRSPPHVTFLYIGEVPEEREQGLLDALSEAFQGKGWPAVQARLDSIDYFQHPDKERNVAHMAVRFSHPMAELRERVKNHLESKGFVVGDSFPVYRPHATLAYMPGLSSTYKGSPVTGSWWFNTIEVWGLPKLHTIPFNPRAKSAQERIPGGLAKGKHPSDFDPEQLAKGMKVELEHTPDRDVAREIAMDHLMEDPAYYDKLEKIEKHAKQYDGISFKPPTSVANAAKKGLEYRRKQKGDKAGLTPEEAGKEGIGSGVQRAVNLKNRDTLSPETVRQMNRFFSRHEKNKSIDPQHKGEPWRDKGYVAWLLWGGDPGKAWVEKVLKQMERADERAKKAFVAEDGWDTQGSHRFVLWPDNPHEESFIHGPVRSLFEAAGYTTGQITRGPELGMGVEFLAEKVAHAHLARIERLNLDRIERFRKDFLMLMKNAKRVKEYDQAWKWREAVTVWQKKFDTFVDRLRKAIKDLRFQEKISKPDAAYWDRKLGSELWGLHIEFRVPLDPLSVGQMAHSRMSDPELKDYLFHKMKQDLPKWEGRVRRASRKAWKALKEFAAWYEHYSKQPLGVDIPTDERVNLEGFQVMVRGFPAESMSRGMYEDFMERFKVGLKRYKQRAQKAMPLLLRSQLPLVVDFTLPLDEGGLYKRNHIAVNPVAAEKNPGRMAQILAHEMGHHIYKTYLSKEDQKFWSRAITGNYGTLDLNEVLRKYGNTWGLFENERIRVDDPILYLQIQGLYDMPGSARAFENILSMDKLREYLAGGGQAKWRVHGKPITGYAHKNNEEAFCEAIGMLVGYGPRAVLPEVRQWLKVILGTQIKVAKMNDSWWELPVDVLYRAEEEEEEETAEEASFMKIAPPKAAGKVASLYLEASAHRRSIALMKFLSNAARRLGVAKHVYVVGGAVRNFVIDQPIKDIDIVIDSVSAGRDSDWFAKELARQIPAPTDITTNQYGVAILTVKGDWDLDGENMKGEVIEIANARSESYAKGKGYKPTEVQPATIEQDVKRREFTFNSLMWRLLDLAKGPDKAEIIDLTGCGLRDLQEGKLKCPADPNKTFSDDPSRMLRAIKFTGKYGFKIPKDVAAAIKRNAKKMKRMPWEAIGKILVENVLHEPTARKSLKQMKELGLLDVVSEMIQEQKPFATYMANQLRRNRKVHLLLDLMDLGVPVGTPLHFLNPKQRQRVRELTVQMHEDEAAKFADKLIKPPVNNKEVIDKLMLPGPQRRHIQPLARELILENPDLAGNPRKLTEMVIKKWR